MDQQTQMSITVDDHHARLPINISTRRIGWRKKTNIWPLAVKMVVGHFKGNVATRLRCGAIFSNDFYL